MENENKSIKGTCEKIDETTYRINGNDIDFLDEGDVELIPIIRDIVVEKENIAIEDYNLSRSSYVLDEKEIPAANLIAEINKWLGSHYIRRKKLENGICYYETKYRKLSVEEELIPLVEDIINEEYRPIEEYKLQKKAYFVNNEAVLVNDIVLRIDDLLSWHDLKSLRVDGIHYRIKGEDFYLEEDDVQIIEELINDESELDRSKYEHKKCVYDTDGNECSIINLSLYIHILFVYEVDDDKVRAELKELCLKDKLDRAKKDFAEKVCSFEANLPILLRRLMGKSVVEYNGINTLPYYAKSVVARTHMSKEDRVIYLKRFLLECDDKVLDMIFEGSDKQIRLLRQKIESEDVEGVLRLIEKRKVKCRNNVPISDIVDEVVNNVKYTVYVPYLKIFYCFIQAFVTAYHEEYEQWKNSEKEGEAIVDLGNELCLERGDKNYIFYTYYYFCEGYLFDRFFHAINHNFIRPELMKSAIDKLQELGLSKYVQERYDEYRKLTGGGRDFCFFKQLDMMKVADELSIYYNVDKSTNEKNYFFTRMYLLKVIDEVIPTLKTRLDVSGFALLLWKSKYFNQSICDKNFSVFRDDITRIFELENLPDVKEEYTAGKGPVKKKARELRLHFQFLKPLVEETYLT